MASCASVRAWRAAAGNGTGANSPLAVLSSLIGRRRSAIVVSSTRRVRRVPDGNHLVHEADIPRNESSSSASSEDRPATPTLTWSVPDRCHDDTQESTMKRTILTALAAVLCAACATPNPTTSPRFDYSIPLLP